MLISPPFLVGTDEASILQAGLKNVPARESTTQAPEGNFPVSQNLMWHTGLHLEAPTKTGGGYAPVRAIADGKVIFVNPSRAKVTDAKDPQAYNPFGSEASWTDNGMIVLEHETEIGADGDTPTKIKFYSSYLHLSKINDAIAKDAQVYRKDTIGETGEIFGHAGEIEMAVACNTEELTKLIGRQPEWQDPKQAPTKDGRTDSIFGNLYIYLPASTPISTTAPTSHLSSANTSSLGTAQWIEINYAKGEGTLTSYATDGSKGNATNEASSEYDLYTEANTRHDSVIAAGATISSPSGWYELLRFGRNLGQSAADKDPLPPNAAHWRKIKTIDGQDVWADLNAPGSFKFSDADFLPVMDWNCYGDDSKPDDQRCDSGKLKDLIADPNDPFTKGDKILAMRIGLPNVLPKLARAICKFPNEWDKNTIVARYQYLKDEAEAAADGALEGWQAFEDHLKIMAFDTLPDAFKQADWHFHPAEFIRTLRKCGWLSRGELVQLLPANSLRKANVWAWEDVSLNSAATLLSKTSTDASLRRIDLNKALRKFNATTPIRLACFFGNATQETQWYQKFHEGSPYWYKPWDGRGFLQLTHAGNYIKYWKFRGLAVSAQVVQTLQQHTTLANNNRPLVNGHKTMYDPTNSLSDASTGISSEIITRRDNVKNSFDAANSAGAYWAWSGASKQADGFFDDPSNNIKVVNTDHGTKHYYENKAFGNVAATVNTGAPSSSFSSIWGVQARFMAFANAQVVLLDTTSFPQSDGSTKEIPEDFIYRRDI
ncbi:M23 family metallopeptidase [Collimonas fungivorans]|uniref:Uncharacterized protein n=1 Tax=Collimonas fungivorans (strain Ter331) TaxID=1005048 RepID=G0AFL1_COLFT|nr:M23 family metallopeptidase [Collimonas fungivorans]AEK64100.1 hypothetical protein CFU_4279 [Collimonas fungivorans Ter331]